MIVPFSVIITLSSFSISCAKWDLLFSSDSCYITQQQKPTGLEVLGWKRQLTSSETFPLSFFPISPTKSIAKLAEAQTKEGSLAPTLFFKPTIQQSRRHSCRMHKSPAENHPPNKEFYSRRRKTRVKVPILVMDKVLRFWTEQGTHGGPGEKRKGREGVGSTASYVMVMGTKSAWDGLSLFALPCFPLFFSFSSSLRLIFPGCAISGRALFPRRAFFGWENGSFALCHRPEWDGACMARPYSARNCLSINVAERNE